MNEREKMLYDVSAASFAVTDVGLYLDTHPNDKAALENLRSCAAALEALRRQYEAKYGPLLVENGAQGGAWAWIDAPWPWQ